MAFYDYVYDVESRITRITDVDGVTDYAYDDRDQLTGADRDAADARGDETYTYDANGNRIDSHLHGSGYVTGEANRLLSDGIYNYEYDAEGNMTRRTRIGGTEPDGSTVREFTWDHRNRLIRVTDSDSSGTATQIVEFTYDSLDRRLSKFVDSDGDGPVLKTALYFIYDREDVILDFLDTDGEGTAETPIVELRYLHGAKIDHVLAQERENAQWLLANPLGTVRDIASDSGSLNSHLVYDSFGRLLTQSDVSTTTRYQFTGREFDPETGYYHYRARQYDPSIGRFLSSDPAVFSSGDSNFYRYVENEPTTGRDPSGRTREQELERQLERLEQRRRDVITSAREQLAAQRQAIVGAVMNFIVNTGLDAIKFDLTNKLPSPNFGSALNNAVEGRTKNAFSDFSAIPQFPRTQVKLIKAIDSLIETTRTDLETERTRRQNDVGRQCFPSRPGGAFSDPTGIGGQSFPSFLGF